MSDFSLSSPSLRANCSQIALGNKLAASLLEEVAVGRGAGQEEKKDGKKEERKEKKTKAYPFPQHCLSLHTHTRAHTRTHIHISTHTRTRILSSLSLAPFCTPPRPRLAPAHLAAVPGRRPAMAKVTSVSHLMGRVAELRRASAAHERRVKEEGASREEKERGPSFFLFFFRSLLSFALSSQTLRSTHTHT